MKTNVFYLSIFSVIFMSLMTISCSKDSETITDNFSADLTSEQSRQTARTEVTTDGLFNIIEIAFSEQEEEGGRIASFFPDCVTVTVSMQNGVKFVTLDFGLGCELPNGNLVSGKIHLTYVLPQAGTTTITYSLENFARNNKFIAGEGSLFRERNNANGNPQHTVNHELVITYPNGLVVDADGTRVAEWIEGIGSGSWADNVFLVTGNRDLNFSTGFSHYAIVTDALRKEVSCSYFVSGQVEITRNNGTGLLDYGDGICDNLATITINGVVYEIVLN